jgi:NDP-sugar pyrophosphorylase family protein/aminoglycoside/choline kinase family phosphotransferase
VRNFRVFILAAGLGERLRPITSHIPKPLLPVLGRPMIERVLDRIVSFSLGEVGMNAHYKWEMMRDWLDRSPYAGRVRLFREVDILGTGGGLKNAEPFLHGSHFIVHNADIGSDIDLAAICKEHASSGNTATLAVHDRKEFNNVWIDRDGQVRHVGRDAPAGGEHLRAVAFTGIAAYTPDFIDLLPTGRSSVIDAWLAASRAGLRVRTIEVGGSSWRDAGTADEYFGYVFESLKNEGETVFFHPSARCESTDFGARTVMEQNTFAERGSALRNCVVMPGAHISAISNIDGAIIGPDFEVSITSPLDDASYASILFPADDHMGQVSLIGIGGSDRKYYRIEKEGITAVLMECQASDPDFERHLLYTRFFSRYSVPVPELYDGESRDPRLPSLPQGDCRYAFFEDLGDITLYSWLHCSRPSARIKEVYGKIVDVLANLHTEVSGHVSECAPLATRIFDYSHLRWETDYFMSRFVVPFGEAGLTVPAGLEKEFHNIAATVDLFPKVIVHRDFQSQNIMITRGLPRVIDYQGARMGPAAYDLASLLWDPYHQIDDGLRSALIDRYSAGVGGYRGDTLRGKDFGKALLLCRLQRHMQALGAYGFLAMEKGKSYFLKYVPLALGYLREEAELAKDDYPSLYRLVTELHAQRRRRF